MMLFYFTLLICTLQYALAAPKFPTPHFYAIDGSPVCSNGVACPRSATTEPESETMFFRRFVAPSRSILDDLLSGLTGSPKPAAIAPTSSPAGSNSTQSAARSRGNRNGGNGGNGGNRNGGNRRGGAGNGAGNGTATSSGNSTLGYAPAGNSTTGDLPLGNSTLGSSPFGNATLTNSTETNSTTALGPSSSDPATLARRRMAIPKFTSPFANSRMLVESRKRQN